MFAISGAHETVNRKQMLKYMTVEPHIELSRNPLDAASVRSIVSGDASFGAITTFEGITRRETDDEHGPLVRLEYEAYESMARKQLGKLASEAAERFSVGRVVIVHRLGSVPPGEASVIIAVASAHRAESFTACRFLIDTLKRDVPIWKKDVFEDGFERWVDPQAGDHRVEASQNA